MLDYLRESADERAIRREHTEARKGTQEEKNTQIRSDGTEAFQKRMHLLYAGSSSAFFLISIFSVSYLRHGNVNILIGIAGILATCACRIRTQTGNRRLQRTQ